MGRPNKRLKMNHRPTPHIETNLVSNSRTQMITHDRHHANNDIMCLDTPQSIHVQPLSSHILADVPPTPPLSRATSGFSSDVLDAFINMPSTAQDKLLTSLIQHFCTKKQLSLMANLILPQLRLDILRNLPKEIALNVLYYLPFTSLCRLASVSRYYHQMVQDNHIWRSLCRKFKYIDEKGLPVGDLRFIRPHKSQMGYNHLFSRNHIVQNNWKSGECTHYTIAGPQGAIVTTLQFDEMFMVIATDNASLGLIQVIDSRNGTLIHQLDDHEGGVWALEFQGDILLSGGCDRDLRVWNLRTGKLKHRLSGHVSTIRCMKMINTQLCVTGSRDSTVRLWNIETGECLWVLTGHSASIRCIASHGDRVVSGSYDNTLRVWNVKSRKQEHILEGHHAQIYSVAFQDNYICSGSLDADIRVWDASQGVCLWTFEGHDALVGHLQLRDEVLLSGGSDGIICLWNVRTGEFIKRIEAHTNSVTTVQFDDNRIVSGGDDGIRIWDIQTGKLVRSLITHVTGVWRLQMSATRLVAAVQNGDRTSVELMDYDIGHDR